MQRLGNNHGGYHGELIDIAAVLSATEQAARQHGWGREVFHETTDFQWLALRRSPATGRLPALHIYISAGIHGDEPAGPLAALQLLQADPWPADAEITLIPCLNPAGFLRNQRVNGQGIDLNRDYLHGRSAEVCAHVAWLERQPKYDLCLCLHEDWEAHGFYVYELNPRDRPSLAEVIVAGVEPVCPIDRSETIEGRPAHGGIIRPDTNPRSRPEWPEAFWLITHRTELSYTLETSSDFPLATRVNALVAGVNAAVRGIGTTSTRFRAV